MSFLPRQVVDAYEEVTLYYEGVRDKLHQLFTIKESARLIIYIVVDRAVDIVLEFDIEERGGSITLFIVGFLEKDQTVAIKTVQRHRASGATSAVFVKSIVGADAQMVYDGLIIIGKNASLSIAMQENKNILLAPSARARSSPHLEILHNDVICKHGSATAQLDDDQLFYMQSRGIVFEAAKMLLLQGFFTDILEKVEDHISKKRLYETVTQRLSLITSTGEFQ